VYARAPDAIFRHDIIPICVWAIDLFGYNVEVMEGVGDRTDYDGLSH
jgi:hypothetical protein